jgi:XTP/dITP diphosphohydrolase
MKKELIFATSNPNKVSEIQSILGDSFAVKSLKDIGFAKELNEPYDTLEANARTKAEQLLGAIGKDCFAEDSGLFVNSLNGEPGVYSARYSGAEATSDTNIALLLEKLEGKKDRSAYFKTVIHLIENGKHLVFTGICEGSITQNPIGEGGFGYDPIFIANSLPNRSFAQLSKAEKNTISHRAKATETFVKHLIEES